MEGFRNLRPGRIEFGRGLNVLRGPNGAGKSNLLEAIYFLFTTRSFRARAAGEMVARGGAAFRIAGEVERTGTRHRVEVLGHAGGRELLLDGRRAGLEDLLARFPVLAVSSHQMGVLRGGPADRRRFLDRGVLGLRPAYLRDLGDYGRGLAQRNRLLRDGRDGPEREAWGERLIAAGARLMEARRWFVERLSAAARALARDLLPEGSDLAVEYRPDAPWPPGTPARDALRKRAARVAGAEPRARHSLFGPHRDDAAILESGQDLGRVGSSGQQRAALLALELARLEMMREARGMSPLLLLDDIDSDLDDAAARRVLDRAARQQSFVSTCRDGRGCHGGAARAFQVRDGALDSLAGTGT